MKLFLQIEIAVALIMWGIWFRFAASKHVIIPYKWELVLAIVTAVLMLIALFAILALKVMKG